MRALFVAILLFAGACHEGNGLGAGDLATVDLMPPADLLPPADLAPPPNCGKIVFCIIGCLGGGGLGGIGGIGGGTGGAGDAGLACFPQCVQNAPPAEAQAAIALGVCAAQNCLSADGGAGGNQLAILQCLQMKCPTQLNACHGIGITS